MSRTIIDSRQITLRQFLQQIANSSTYAGVADAKPANQTELDNLLVAINDELTPLLSLSSDSPASLVLNVGAAVLTNSESSRNRSIPHIGALLPNTFSSGTITFPASSGGTITVSPGNNAILTVASGNYIKVLIYMDATGALNVLPGVENAVEASTSVLAAPKKTLPIGYVTLQNIAGVIQNVTQDKIFQFGTGAGGGSGSGSGVGDDLNALTFKASFTDGFDDLPSGADSAVDVTVGQTDSTLYSAQNAYYRLAYDASKTIAAATTTTNINISAVAAFTVKAGDVVVTEGQARKITAVISQSSFTTEAFSVAPTLAAQVTISQAVYTKDLNNLAGDGLAISTAFSTSINQVLVTYEDTTAVNDVIYDANTAPVIAFSASSDGTAYTDVVTRPTALDDTQLITDLPTAGTNLYLRLFANQISGAGSVNVLGYKAYLHRDIVYSDGLLQNQAYCFTDGVGTEINCSTPTVMSGKTRVQLNWTFPVGINAGTTNGAITVHLNGAKIPRYVDAVITPDASYKETDQRTIELDLDYSASNFSVEVTQTMAVLDNSETNTTNISQLQQHQFKNYLINSNFDFWQEKTNASLAFNEIKYAADQWYAKNTLGVNGVMGFDRVGGSPNSKYGARILIGTTPTSGMSGYGAELYQVIDNFNTLDLLGQNISAGAMIQAIGNVNQVGIQFFYASSEIKPTNPLGTESLVTVNSSTFTVGQILAQAVGGLPGNAGVVAIRIRITGVSTGNNYDSGNGFIVSSAILNIGSKVAPYSRQGRNSVEELNACKKFFEAIGTPTGSSGVANFSAGLFSTTTAGDMIQAYQEKRAIPVFTIISPTTFRCNNGTSNFAVSAAAASNVTTAAAVVNFTVAGAAINAPFNADTLTTGAFHIDARI